MKARCSVVQYLYFIFYFTLMQQH